MTASSTRRIVSSNSDRKFLDDAVSHVSKGWMPISSKVISLVRGKLDKGDYEDKRYELVADLRKDFSLFAWFLAQLSELKEAARIKDSIDIEEIVKTIEIQQLIEIFGKADENHLHKTENAIKSQHSALKQGLTAVISTEMLANSKKLDGNLAHICVGVRQLGINLVAWNYPRIFARAVEACQKSGSNLDKELLKILGYSPLQLGVEIALDWDKTGGLKAMVFQDKEMLCALPTAVRDQIGDRAIEIMHCVDLGEAVSKLSAPEVYPAIAGLMPNIIGDVEQILGKGGFQKLRKHLSHAANEYSSENSDDFSLDIEPEKITKIAQNQLANQLVQANPWVSKCPSLYQEKFKNLYLHIDKYKISPTAINILVGEVIPSLGFTKGCVYIVEDNKNELNPILRIGDAPLTRYRQLDCSASDHSSRPVIAALGYTAPLIQENVAVNGEFVSHVTGIFGGKEKSGVLYLEMSEELIKSSDRSEPLLFFKAIRQALSDCLNIN